MGVIQIILQESHLRKIGFAVFLLLGCLFIFTRPNIKIKQALQSQLIFIIEPSIARQLGNLLQLVGTIVLILALFFFPQITNLDCNRSSSVVKCEMTNKYWFGNIKPVSIPELLGAELEKKVRKNSSAEEDISYDILLLTDNTKIPLYWTPELTEEELQHWTGNDPVKPYEKVIDQINNFVNSKTDNTLNIQQNNQDLVDFSFSFAVFLLFAGTFVSSGIAPTTYCELNQKSEKFILKRYKFIFFTTYSYELPLKNITKAAIEYFEDSPTNRITLILNSNERFPLTNVYSSDEKREVFIAIQNFLKSYNSQQKQN